MTRDRRPHRAIAVAIATAALPLSWLAAAALADGAGGAVTRSCDPAQAPCLTPVSMIAFTSTRHNPTVPVGQALEIHLMDADGANVRRLTDNSDGEAFAALSPDGKGRIVFDSNRARLPGEPLNTSDLFIMNQFGEDQTYLTRGSGASWSPDSKAIAYQRSASGTGLPTRPGEPGAPTSDSEIFVIDNLGDFQDGLLAPRNLTNSPGRIDEDADWSPLGDRIAYTSKNADDNPVNSTTAELYLRNADGSGTPTRLTFNFEEERAATWSPDGTRILFMCRRSGPDFELCVINADGTGLVQITENSLQELTPSWSPEGSEILFHRPIGSPAGFELFRIRADGSGEVQITDTPGINGWAKFGVLREIGQSSD
jgi:TolB protein